ncbi:hypothetical protein AK830_g7394 [Neonectria ditissima]|uniref:Uncharacterized protein n=1 Tax=Neonectria ditissima TaxID=78410 RepID=A0A0P7AZS2_9HYPO|nr:hypothetical protein AK830_g7394 [Neonectria ditissima]
MTEGPHRWKGFRVLLKEHNSSMFIAQDDEVLSQTIGKIHGTGYFGPADPNSSVRPPIGEWIVTEVLTRGINLWDREFFAPEGTFGQKMHARMGNGSPNPSVHFLVGYSPYTLEHVFAGPPRTNTNVANLQPDDTLSILQYRKNPGETILGSKTILHHALSVPGNMWCLKVVLDS